MAEPKLLDYLRWFEKDDLAIGADDRRTVTLTNALQGLYGPFNQAQAQLAQVIDRHQTLLDDNGYVLTEVQLAKKALSPVINPNTSDQAGATVSVDFSLPSLLDIATPDTVEVLKDHPLDPNETLATKSLDGITDHVYEATVISPTAGYDASIAVKHPAQSTGMYIWDFSVDGVAGGDASHELSYILESQNGDMVKIVFELDVVTGTDLTVRMVTYNSDAVTVTYPFYYPTMTLAEYSKSLIKLELLGDKVRLLLDGTPVVTGETDGEGYWTYVQIDGITETFSSVYETYYQLDDTSDNNKIKRVTIGLIESLTEDQIYYTLDGKEPTDLSTVWDGTPVNVPIPSLVRARIAHPSAEAISESLAYFGSQGATNSSKTVTAATYVLLGTDKDKLIYMESVSAQTLQIPQDLSEVEFPVGSRVDIVQSDVGVTTIEEQGAVTITALAEARSLVGEGAAVTIIRKASNDYVLVGAIE